ncbi:hypothetical protein B566_EDAN014713 [Ephemera danica]|nr:hypothetical protein B566_EDAN014713 [Ephemera danica]
MSPWPKACRAENRHKNYLKNCLCVVPGCENTRFEMPHKLFFSFPSDPRRKMKWENACGVRTKKVKVPHYKFIPVCEDHFNLPEDLSNWYQYQLVPGTKPRLKPTAVPRVNQTVRPQTTSELRAKKRMVAELLATAVEKPVKTKRRKKGKNAETEPADPFNEQHCIPLDADDIVDQTDSVEEEPHTSGSETVYIKTEPWELLETEILEPIEALQNPENETVYIKTEQWNSTDPIDETCIEDQVDDDPSEPIDKTEDQPDPLQTIDLVESEAPIAYRLPIPVSPPPIDADINNRDFGIQTQPPVTYATREFSVQARPVQHRSWGTQVLLKPKTVDRGCSPIQFLDEPTPASVDSGKTVDRGCSPIQFLDEPIPTSVDSDMKTE